MDRIGSLGFCNITVGEGVALLELDGGGGTLFPVPVLCDVQAASIQASIAMRNIPTKEVNLYCFTLFSPIHLI